MKKCPKCGSEKLTEIAPNNGIRQWLCSDCGSVVRSDQTNAPNHTHEPKGSYDPISTFLKYFKDMNFQNFKQKLLNTKMIIHYLALFVLLVSILFFYNLGKSDGYERKYLLQQAEYQELVVQNEARLTKLKFEIVSYSDLLDELRDYKQNKKEKQKEITTLENSIKTLTKDTNDLKDEIKELKAEKNKLTGEIAKAKGKGYVLTAGFYSGGDDIPVGTYNIIWISGYGNVFVGNDVVETFGQGTYAIKTFKNCYVGDGTEIKISDTVKVSFKSKS